jgi:hypothetical protein
MLETLDKIITIFIEFCFRFMDLPIRPHSSADNNNIGFILFLFINMMITGINFCRVIASQNVIFLEIRKHIGINQLWNGAAPNFTIRVKIINSLGVTILVLEISFLTILNNKKIDLSA